MNLCCYGREMSVIVSLYLCFLQREVLQFCLCSNTFVKVVLEVLYKYFFPTQINILHQSCLCLFCLFLAASHILFFSLSFVAGYTVNLGRTNNICLHVF